MTARDPIAALDTHEVTNQPPPVGDIDLWRADPALREAFAGAGGDARAAALGTFGVRAGTAEAAGWAAAANRVVPVLESHDHWGRRIDEVRFHPGYHRLMALGLEAGIAAAPWDGAPAGFLRHTALTYMMAQVDAGPVCPMTMTSAAVAALREAPQVAAEWEPRVRAARYDPACRPAAGKAGATIGMAMTEKQGGSDVRANTTRAEPAGDGRMLLTGHKWFCSAPMSDAFLTLAQAPGGLGCYLLPRWLPEGGRNAGFRIVRLKDKLGDRSNASAEVEYDRAHAWPVGPEGRGVATIIRMVNQTRLDCVAASAGIMRAALVQAIWHARHRSAFQRRLVDQPAMTAVLADLALEAEAAMRLALRLAAAFDAGGPLARLLTPVAKYWVCKRAAGMVCEAMECLGGSGYVETGPMARLYRQAPLNAIWEGSGNVIALDVLRAMAREPDAVAAFRAFLDDAAGQVPSFDAWADSLDLAGTPEARARHLLERMGLAAAAAAMIAGASPAAEAFCRLRLAAPAAGYGAGAAEFDADGIVAAALRRGE